MNCLTLHTDAKAKSFCATECNKAHPANGPTFGVNPINLMNTIQFKCLLCKELNLKALPAPCIELFHNICKTNEAVINAHKRKVENAVRDTIKEIVNLLDPDHHFNMGVQASKAQKVACGDLQNHTCKMAIALSREFHESANVFSKWTSTLTRNQTFLVDE